MLCLQDYYNYYTEIDISIKILFSGSSQLAIFCISCCFGVVFFVLYTCTGTNVFVGLYWLATELSYPIIIQCS